jgi:hypothetical protein
MATDNPTQWFADRLARIAADENAKRGNRWDILIYVRDSEETPAIRMAADATRKSSMRVNFTDPDDLDIAQMEIGQQIKGIKARGQQ